MLLLFGAIFFFESVCVCFPFAPQPFRFLPFCPVGSHDRTRFILFECAHTLLCFLRPPFYLCFLPRAAAVKFAFSALHNYNCSLAHTLCDHNKTTTTFAHTR
uniref:Uncharacterized protein n=1 Tax=Anopheles arabiensis TaxID=7173 RepID=A0A182IH63_ANOAR